MAAAPNMRRVIERPIIIHGDIGRQSGRIAYVRRRVVDAEASVEDRLVGDLVGSAHARRKVQVVAAQAAARDTVGSHLFQGSCRDGGNKGVFLVVDFGPGPAEKVLIVHTQIQGQPVADLVVVLRIEG